MYSNAFGEAMDSTGAWVHVCIAFYLLTHAPDWFSPTALSSSFSSALECIAHGPHSLRVVPALVWIVHSCSPSGLCLSQHRSPMATVPQ